MAAGIQLSVPSVAASSCTALQGEGEGLGGYRR
jgi:hypothetical protein